MKQHMVAVVTDGSAVLGLGDIGPEAALPVMEGKAMLFKEFGGVNAFPLCLATKDVDEIVATVKAVAPGFGGINLEDISAPRCFEVERRLREELDIPVFHDDQHGTAIVVFAALINALKVVGKDLGAVKIVTTGCGAAGTAVTKVLLNAGARTIVGCDEGGVIYRGRPGLAGAKRDYAELTNPEDERGSADEVLAGADVFIGLSVPGAITRAGVERMAADAIVFALANPRGEIEPEAIEDLAAVIATGRSDYPNQINNVLAFPGVFRGALDVRARAITPGMELAAAHAIASAIPPDELAADYIVPSVFARQVAPAVARSVAEAAVAAGVARGELAVATGLAPYDERHPSAHVQPTTAQRRPANRVARKTRRAAISASRPAQTPTIPQSKASDASAIGMKTPSDAASIDHIRYEVSLAPIRIPSRAKTAPLSGCMTANRGQIRSAECKHGRIAREQAWQPRLEREQDEHEGGAEADRPADHPARGRVRPARVAGAEHASDDHLTGDRDASRSSARKIQSWKAIWCAPSGAAPIRASTDAATRNDAYSAVVRTKIWRPTRSSGRISASRGRFERACGRSSSTANATPIPACAIAVPPRRAGHAPVEAVDEQHLEHQVDHVRRDDDLERAPQVRDAAQVALAGERDQRGGQAERRDPQVEEREIARPSVPAERAQERRCASPPDDEQRAADRDRDPQRLRRQARRTLATRPRRSHARPRPSCRT